MQNMLLMTITGFLFPSKHSLYVQACIYVYLIHPFFCKRELIYVYLITYIELQHSFIPSHTNFHRICSCAANLQS
uniref:Uncharacterized protein n=1 Tax=Pan troglodytes TaxID=9598 RepID=A0A2I3TLT7_PANTR